MFLGTRIKQGRTDPENRIGAGFYTVKFEPADFQIRSKFLIKHISIKGPSGSSLQVYTENVFRGTTPNGDLNEWDPSQPLPIIPGQTLYFYWDTGTGSVPMATVDCYTDDFL